ncbi:MAG: SDR family oxidoreductase [Gemmatimonadaceae bacterium]
MTKPIAVVTGASKGIGRATALRLAKTYDIVAIARSTDALQSLTREIERLGGSCRPVTLDLRKAAAVSAALADIDAAVLVNNAGVGTLKPMLDLTSEQWSEMVDVNFNALFEVTRALLPAMIRRESGHVVFIGSIAGRSAFTGGSCYAATKHAVMAMAECLMLEVREHGVKVSVVNPGGVATDFGSGRGDTSWKIVPEDVAEAVATVVDTPPNVLVHRLEVRALNVPKKK